MWDLKELIQSCSETQAEINGKWVPSRPLKGGLFERLRDAWSVLVGKADAVKWPGGQ